jgi:hypothetical protein
MVIVQASPGIKVENKCRQQKGFGDVVQVVRPWELPNEERKTLKLNVYTTKLFISLKNKMSSSRALVGRTCNPSHSGGRDQEDSVVRSQPWANSSWDPISKMPNTKRGWQSNSSSKSTFLTSVRPWVQTPMPKKKISSLSLAHVSRWV